MVNKESTWLWAGVSSRSPSAGLMNEGEDVNSALTGPNVDAHNQTQQPTATMKHSPSPPSLASVASARAEAMKPFSSSFTSSSGMGWLLDSGKSSKQSSASLLSVSSGGGGGGGGGGATPAPGTGTPNNYYSFSNHASTERMRRMPSRARVQSSTEIKRLHSSFTQGSIPGDTIMAGQDQPRPRPQPPIQSSPVDVLSQSVQACTSTIFGLYGLEMWQFDKKSGSLLSVPIKQPGINIDLRRQARSLFIKRAPQEADYDSPYFDSAARDAFERLTDNTRLDYISKTVTDPGLGPAGALWSEASGNNALTRVQEGVQSIGETIHRRVGLLAGLPHESHEHQHASSVLWREIDTLAEDPDQPYDERLQHFAKAGFKLAAGIPFDIRGFKGIVVFYANPHADPRKLRDPDNSRLIQFAAQFIGSAAAIQYPIKKATLVKNKRPLTNWKVLRVKILAVVRFQRPILFRRRGRSRSFGSPTMRRVDSFRLSLKRVGSFVMDKSDREASYKLLSEATTRLRNDITKSVVDAQYASKKRTMKWWQKVKGGHASTPPAFNTVQCMWTFAGVSSTHLILSWLDWFIQSKSGGSYRLMMGPLGALTTLQYNLTAAPASQPRNAFFSQVFALCTCYFLHQFEGLDQWHRCALAPAIVTTMTARLGIIHPPAGATSVLFSYAGYKLEENLIFLIGVLIAIFMAVVINNLSDKRQYPSTRWTICHSFVDSL